jgi:phospholipase/carboxylesterase
MSSEQLLPCVELDPPESVGPARAAVIWLHGLGADGHDFVPIVPALGLPEELAVRFVFPHAPKIPVSINMGFVMPAWYDIGDIDLEKRHDQVGVRRSAQAVTRLIERENARGVPSERIVLAGFSQGGAIALFTGVRHPQKLAGLIGLSTYMVLGDSLAAEAGAANRDTPDPDVPRQPGSDGGDFPRPEIRREPARFGLPRGLARVPHAARGRARRDRRGGGVPRRGAALTRAPARHRR